MLQQLTIKNYAIIQEAKIAFDPQLNIITGETGAGKSIVMGALGLILGERADTKVLMHGDQKCIVEGKFKVTGYHLEPFFERNELDYDDQCILRREISTSGKSRAFINDTPASLQQLKEIGASLVEIVSQHETLELNEKGFQLNLVDIIGENSSILIEYSVHYKQLKAIQQRMRQAIEDEEKARKDEDYLRFVLKELADINPLPDEQEQLEKQLEVLSHADIIQQSTALVSRALDEDEQSITDQLRALKSSLQQAAKYQELLLPLMQRLEAATIELKDLAAEMDQVAQQAQSDPKSLQTIEERLQALFSLQKKHRVNTNIELIALHDKLQHDLNKIGSLQEEIEKLQKDELHATGKLQALADELHKRRVKAIPQIEKKVNELLANVEMKDAQLKADLKVTEHFMPEGKDEITLLFTANKGAPLLPIHKVASGGELSRLMLCIKSLMSDRVALPTIVFDEIDTGISGEAALKVSAVMKSHSRSHQVLAITHLPQIAGKADAHYYVFKTSAGDTTHTSIRKLNKEEQLAEIARMLHGSNPSAKVIEAAKELIG